MTVTAVRWSLLLVLALATTPLRAFLHSSSLPTMGSEAAAARRRTLPSAEGVRRAHPYARLLRRSVADVEAKATSALDEEEEECDVSSTLPSIALSEVDVRHGGLRTELRYDADLERFVSVKDDHHGHRGTKEGDCAAANGLDADGRHGADSLKLNKEDASRLNRKFQRYVRFARRSGSKFTRLLRSSFLPEGVTPSYYAFIRWRILQRFVNANVHVFGTQSLLLGLGIKNRNSLGLSAALNWVLKDALGKIVRMVWASRMGRKFDSDAKRWRFRSSLLFAAGNGLEVSTYVFPELFLLCATLANCFKQMSMLTSSATRNALYNSFRDQRRQNIGDITAKGEAQIAVVDLLGIASGVCLSRAVGVSVRSVLTVWILLQVAEIFCMYHEIRSVEFSMLNFERMWSIADGFVKAASEQGGPSPKSANVTADALALGVPTPRDVARRERIFLPPDHLSRRAIAFGSLGRAKLAPDELADLIDVFGREKFLLVVGEDVKNKRRGGTRGGRGRGGAARRFFRRLRHGETTTEEEAAADLERARSEAKANCHIVLHADANNAVIVKSTLALSILRKKLAETTTHEMVEAAAAEGGAPPRRTRDCIDLIRETRAEADKSFPRFLNVLSSRGWEPPAKYMFGRVSMRAEWPIRQKPPAQAGGAEATAPAPAQTAAEKPSGIRDKAKSEADVAKVIPKAEDGDHKGKTEEIPDVVGGSTGAAAATAELTSHNGEGGSDGDGGIQATSPGDKKPEIAAK